MNENISPLVSMRKITKNFDGVHALKGVDIDIYGHEVLGIVGDNGAGKSTLIKILCGAYHATSGEIYFEDKKVEIKNPRVANELGIDVVYQDLALVDEFDVSKNIFLGKEIYKPILGKFFQITDDRKMLKESSKLLNRLKISIADPRSKTEDLSGGQRQSVAISRALIEKEEYRKKLLILDEPTAALGVNQKQKVYELIKKLNQEGLAIIIISHNIEDIFEFCDRIIVLFAGKVAGVRKKDMTNKEDIVSLICGIKKS